MSIEVSNLTHIYSPGQPEEQTALDGISFTVEDGSFVGIIGHTGSGKSTLVQHLNGILRPTRGKIYVDGEDITQKNVSLNYTSQSRMCQRVKLSMEILIERKIVLVCSFSSATSYLML